MFLPYSILGFSGTALVIKISVELLMCLCLHKHAFFSLPTLHRIFGTSVISVKDTHVFMAEEKISSND